MNAATHPLLGIYQQRRRLATQLRRAQDKPAERTTRAALKALDGEERSQLLQLRLLAAQWGISQEKVARRLRVHRTMVNKVWNGGQAGRQREWVRSKRVIEATYRELEAAGWTPGPAKLAPA